MRSILIILMLLPIFAYAKNYLGFGGGNYVYAEQDNLYFNLNENVFDHRTWTYDGTNFKSEIAIKMPLKTKYSSEFETFVVAQKEARGFMLANYIKQPYTIKNQGHYQKTIAFAPVLVPLAGAIARSFAWNRFKSWALGSAFVYGAGKYFCSEIMKDNISCGTGEAFVKTTQYAYISVLSDSLKPILQTPIRVTNADYIDKQKLVNVVSSKVAPSYIVSNGGYQRTLSLCRMDGTTVRCTYTSPSNGSGSFLISFTQENKTLEELVSDPELMPYFDKTCKLFPSECVNEPTNGKNVQDVVLTGGSIGSPVSVIGPPYTNPLTGTAQQDQVTIGGASSGIGVNSATNSDWKYNPTLGESAVTNSVQVGAVARPDLTNTDTAPVAKPNVQTGEKPQVIVPPVTVPEFTDLNDMIDFCAANPSATSCIDAGTGQEAQSIFDSIKIPEIPNPATFARDTFMPENGSCPAPSSYSTRHGTIMYSYEKHCQVASMLRPFIIAFASLTGLYLIFFRKA